MKFDRERLELSIFVYANSLNVCFHLPCCRLHNFFKWVYWVNKQICFMTIARLLSEWEKKIEFFVIKFLNADIFAAIMQHEFSKVFFCFSQKTFLTFHCSQLKISTDRLCFHSLYISEIFLFYLVATKWSKIISKFHEILYFLPYFPTFHFKILLIGHLWLFLVTFHDENFTNEPLFRDF